MVQNQQTVTEF